MSGGLVIVVAFLVLMVAAISIQNKIKVSKIRIDQSASGIDTALTNRYDVLTKLVQVTKDYMNHEKESYNEIVKLRQNLSKMSLEEKRVFDQKISEFISQTKVILEDYPELKSNEVVINLQDAIKDAEEQIYASRRFYNSNVAYYNETIAIFPNSLIANSMNCQAEKFFEADSHKKEDVDVRLI